MSDTCNQPHQRKGAVPGGVLRQPPGLLRYTFSVTPHTMWRLWEEFHGGPILIMSPQGILIVLHANVSKELEDLGDQGLKPIKVSYKPPINNRTAQGER